MSGKKKSEMGTVNLGEQKKSGLLPKSPLRTLLAMVVNDDRETSKKAKAALEAAEKAKGPNQKSIRYLIDIATMSRSVKEASNMTDGQLADALADWSGELNTLSRESAILDEATMRMRKYARKIRRFETRLAKCSGKMKK